MRIKGRVGHLPDMAAGGARHSLPNEVDNDGGVRDWNVAHTSGPGAVLPARGTTSRTFPSQWERRDDPNDKAGNSGFAGYDVGIWQVLEVLFAQVVTFLAARKQFS